MFLMHCELAVPGLLAAGAATRCPGLELLLARGRKYGRPQRKLERWLGDAFGLGDAPLAAGALTLLGCAGDPGEASWARADPVHLRLMRDRLVVVPAEAFAVTREEAEMLCEALNRHFAGTLSLIPCEPRRWSAKLGEEIAMEAENPLEVAGRSVDPGSGATRWHALVNEAQMVLHEHPVNEAREARGEPALNSIWPWGAGRAPQGASSPWQSVAADEPSALGAARLAGARHRALPPSAGDWLERLSGESRHLALLDALRAPAALGEIASYEENLNALEAKWFGPLLGALRAGRIGMVTLHVPDAGLAFETIRTDLRRFWRRPKSLDAYA